MEQVEDTPASTSQGEGGGETTNSGPVFSKIELLENTGSNACAQQSDFRSLADARPANTP